MYKLIDKKHMKLKLPNMKKAFLEAKTVYEQTHKKKNKKGGDKK